MVDRYIYIYNYGVHGVYKPTYNWGGPSCRIPVPSVGLKKPTRQAKKAVSLRELAKGPEQNLGEPTGWLVMVTLW